MRKALDFISKRVGDTPMIPLEHDKISLYTKLEYYNNSGSIKDRPALRIISQAILQGKIDENTTVIESSSGNFAIALAHICRSINIRFIAVIDPNINKEYEKLLSLICHDVIKVDQADHTGGYLLTRLATVKKFLSTGKNYYWPNQYENVDNRLSYYHGLGKEICNELDHLDFIFVAVSSGGTIAGLSMRLKEKFPDVKIIGVDVEGSIIFGGNPGKRYVSGIGASKSSSHISEIEVDDVIIVSHLDIITGCETLLKKHMVFGGASAGAVYFAIDKYFRNNPPGNQPTVLFPCPDKGNAYQDTIYNAQWQNWLKQVFEDLKPVIQ